MFSPRLTRNLAQSLTTWLTGLSAGALAAVCLVACGGGGTSTASNGSGIGSGGTGSFTTGSISGFGSIIVNGIRYDNAGITAASQDDGSATELKLGMVVDVEGGSTSDVTTSTGTQTVAKATSIKVGVDLLGPVSTGSVNTTDGTFSSLGQTVHVTVDTFFDQAAGGLSGVGNTVSCPYVRVYGFPRTAGGYTASRVECLSVRPAYYRVRGPVTQVSGGTVYINDGGPGGVSCEYALSNGLTAPSVGQIVRAVLSVSGQNGTIVSFKGEARPLSQTREARAEGVVTDYSAANGTLHVNGVPVQVSSSTTLQPIELALTGSNLRVEVRGQLLNGVLNATWIKQETERYDYPSSSGGSGGGGLREIELHGLVASLNMGCSQCFKTRDVTVYYTSTSFPPGSSASNLANGVAVEVKGVRNTEGSAIVAKEIKFSND